MTDYDRNTVTWEDEGKSFSGAVRVCMSVRAGFSALLIHRIIYNRHHVYCERYKDSSDQVRKGKKKLKATVPYLTSGIEFSTLRQFRGKIRGVRRTQLILVVRNERSIYFRLFPLVDFRSESLTERFVGCGCS